jgi:DNA-binding transcriptional ArsR family regulator
VRIRIRLPGAELARVRFAVSPVYETVMALGVLARPGVHAVHLPWARWARPRLATVEHLPLLRALVGRDGFTPGFLVPAPTSRMPDLDAELRAVRSTSPADARAGTARLTSKPARRFRDDPRAGLPHVVDALRRCHDLVIAPYWERMVRLLDADIAFRAGALATGGFENLFTDLHDDVAWTGEELVVHPRQSPSTTVDLPGHGLVLCPSVFCWPRVTASTDPPTVGTVRYPARGVATLWETVGPPPEALANLIGRTRAAILTRLASPQTTGGLAAGLGVTAGAVSQHLAVLKDAGLVATRREGRATVHLRTDRANALIAGEPAQPFST